MQTFPPDYVETMKQAETYPLSARNLTIANNLILSNREKINVDYGLLENCIFEGNIFHSTHKNSELSWNLPKEGYRQVDPQLIQQNELMKLSPQSPAIDAAIGDYAAVNRDIHGNLRTNKKDIGSEERSRSPKRRDRKSVV